MKFCAAFRTLVEFYIILVTFPERRQAVQTRKVRWAPLTIARTLRRLGFQRRRVMLCAWLMWFPYLGPFPQISQDRATVHPHW